MDNQVPDQQKLVEALYAYAAQRMKSGTLDWKIIDELKAKGLNEEAARTIVSKLRPMYTQAKHKAGTKNMIIGGLWCAGGLIVTLVSLGMAAGGGTYLVAWGAIIFGAVQFFRGVAQSAGGRGDAGRHERPGGDVTSLGNAYRTPSPPAAKENASVTGDAMEPGAIGGLETVKPVFSAAAKEVFHSAPAFIDRPPVFIRWNDLPELTRYEFTAAFAGTGSGRPLAVRPAGQTRLFAKRLLVAVAALALGALWYVARLGTAANSPLDVIVFSLAAFGAIFTLGWAVVDLARLARLPVQAGIYLFPSGLAETRPSGILLRPLVSATAVWRYAKFSTKSSEIEISFGKISRRFPVAEGDVERIHNVIQNLRRAATGGGIDPEADGCLRSDPFVRFGLLEGNRPAADPAVRRTGAGFSPLLPVMAAASALLAFGAGYGCWTLFNRASDDAMYAALMRDLSTPAYRDYLAQGGRLHIVSPADLRSADKAKALEYFNTFKTRESVKEWRRFLTENEDPELDKAARAEIAALYDRAYAKLRENAPGNAPLAAYFKALFAYCLGHDTSLLHIRFETPSMKQLELMDRLVEKLSDLDEKIAPIAPCFKEGAEWISYSMTARHLNRGLQQALPYGTVEAVFDEERQTEAGVPLLHVSYALLPNGSVYEDSGSSSGRLRAPKYYAGLDIAFTLQFSLPEGGKEYTCRLSVSPPDRFTSTNFSSRAGSSLGNREVYTAMIIYAFKDMPEKVMQAVFQIDAGGDDDEEEE